MTIKDYQGFLNKIQQLNNLVDLVENSPEKYSLLTKCKTHNEVVSLARNWGYEIGKQWGEY
tara:strand:- start:517 stop:699 length:183 start_codon:yes stop_codon:yes gene_type:complete